MTSAFYNGKKDGFCDECGLEATLKCSGCKYAMYCGTVCQKVAWRKHKRECKDLAAGGAPKSSTTIEPAAPRSPEDFERRQQVDSIAATLKEWQEAHESGNLGAVRRLEATIRKYGTDPEMAFTPPITTSPLRQSMISICRLYFIDLVSSLPSSKVGQLGRRLSSIPPFGYQFEGFSGKEVENPAELTEDEYLWIMKTVQMALMGLVDEGTVERWVGLGESFVFAESWEGRNKGSGEEDDDDDE
ncbi:hypothetical protein T439DRAFT_321339 [Meredithblackwellia eburnea MCA 4105]